MNLGKERAREENPEFPVQQTLPKSPVEMPEPHLSRGNSSSPCKDKRTKLSLEQLPAARKTVCSLTLTKLITYSRKISAIS